MVKALLFLAIAIAGIVAYRFTPLKEWLQPAGAAADWVRQTGFRGVAAFFLVMALLIVVGFRACFSARWPGPCSASGAGWR